MTKFLETAGEHQGEIGFGSFMDGQPASKPRRLVLKISLVLCTLLLAAFVGGYFYWRSFEGTPQYSLALLVDAARRHDEAQVDEIVEIDAVVEDFMPQITGRAVELYGRGLPPQTIAKVELVARPIMPALKQRAKAKLPSLIRKKTERFDSVPFAAMVLGADRYLDIRPEGNVAIVKSKLPEHGFEVRMQRHGTGWKIVSVRDDELATEIAQTVGQEIIAVASHGGVEAAGSRLGIGNLNTILRQAEEIFR